ncbi:MAG: hypothetical protein RLZZ179_1023 [Verrucomicrobiota bacterium]|jgi:hypothetical protein
MPHRDMNTTPLDPSPEMAAIAPSTRSGLAPSDLNLPQVHLVARNPGKGERTGWSFHYGAVETASSYAGIRIPSEAFDAIWAHGCCPPWLGYSAGTLCYASPVWKEIPILAWRQDLADRMTAEGARHVTLTGAPILYSNHQARSRIPRSLLVMPMHTLQGQDNHDRAALQRYADEIAGFAHHFSRVVVCVHAGCRTNGLWHREFGVHSIPVIDGADANDVNALARMKSFFSGFESMTTNGWGSHVAYALAFGCRVSIFGKALSMPRQQYLKDRTWQLAPGDLDILLAAEREGLDRKHLADFCRDPNDGKANVEMGRFLIGADHQLSPAEMKRLLVRVTGGPLRHAARHARDLMRRAAAGLRGS